MTKLLLNFFIIFCSLSVYSQQDFLYFKKKNKTLGFYKKTSYIIFRVNKQWFTGYIEKVQHDSFYVKPFMVHYSWTGADTTYYNTMQFALTDVSAMLNKGVQVGYKTGTTAITTEGGNVHWYWIKSGWIFRAGALGYATLNVANGIIKNNFSFSGSHFGITTPIYVFGVLLKHFGYEPYFKLGRKYYLQSVNVSGL